MFSKLPLMLSPALVFLSFLQAFRMQSTVLTINKITRTILQIQVFMSYTSPFYIIKSLLFNLSNTRIFVVNHILFLIGLLKTTEIEDCLNILINIDRLLIVEQRMIKECITHTPFQIKECFIHRIARYRSITCAMHSKEHIKVSDVKRQL